MFTRVLVLLIVGAAGFALGLAAVPSVLPRISTELARPGESGARRPLVIGTVSSHPRDDLLAFEAFGHELVSRLGAFDVAHFEPLPTVAVMVDAIAAGQVDVYVDGPVPIAQVNASIELQPLALCHRDGVERYASTVFVRSDSDIRSLADLAGRTIAFTTPHSTSGFGLPLTHLFESGLRLQEAAAPGDREINYLLSMDAETSFLWVLRGRVDAAALGVPQLARLTGDDESSIRVLATTEELPRYLLCARPDLDIGTTASIKDAVLQMSEDDAGRRALLRFGHTARFSLLPAESFADVVRFDTRLRRALGQ